jgi:hypothetical protein
VDHIKSVKKEFKDPRRTRGDKHTRDHINPTFFFFFNETQFLDQTKDAAQTVDVRIKDAEHMRRG